MQFNLVPGGNRNPAEEGLGQLEPTAPWRSLEHHYVPRPESYTSQQSQYILQRLGAVSYCAYPGHRTSLQMKSSTYRTLEGRYLITTSRYMKVRWMSMVRMNRESSVTKKVSHRSLSNLYKIYSMLKRLSYFQKWAERKQHVFSKTNMQVFQKVFWKQ